MGELARVLNQERRAPEYYASKSGNASLFFFCLQRVESKKREDVVEGSSPQSGKRAKKRSLSVDLTPRNGFDVK